MTECNYNFTDEKWIIIKECSKYEISNYGRIKSYRTSKPKIISLVKDKYGYLYAKLIDNKNIRRSYRISKLVAKYFVPNPNNYTIIDYKDNDRSNNYYKNLKWCSDL